VTEIGVVPSDELAHGERAALRALFERCWGDFSQADWNHMFPADHVLVERGGRIVSHGAVIERELRIGDVGLRTGYVENVATEPEARSNGYATLVMQEAARLIRASFELGALDSGAPGFYERLGWERWRGPTAVRRAGRLIATPGEDGAVLVLRTPATPPLDLDARISCEDRPGDVW
jgi:aminoglycoside 2'-N-acetyltransferase I